MTNPSAPLVEVMAVAEAVAVALVKMPRSRIASLPADELLAFAGHIAATRQPASEGRQAEGAVLAKALHYPDCWDTAAYPTLESAIHEAAAWKCSVCNPTQPPSSPVEARQGSEGLSDAKLEADALKYGTTVEYQREYRQSSRDIAAMAQPRIKRTTHG